MHAVQKPRDIYLTREKKKDIKVKKMLSVTLHISKGEKMLVACNRELGIVTQGKDWNALMKNIRDVIETYFDIPSADSVKINLEIDPTVNDNAETASC